MSKKVFVTGGTGFLGSYLIRSLVQQGEQVVALKRPSSSMELLGDTSKMVEWVEGNLLDVVSLEEAMRDIDEVYHCAAFVSFLPRDKEQMFKINIEGTANMVNAALEANVDKFLYVSSIAALGRKKNQIKIDESVKWENSPLNSNYAISKFKGESEVWRGQAEGLNTVIINPSMIIGSGKWQVGTNVFFDKIWKGLAFYPIGKSGFVDVRDVVKTMTGLMKKPISNQRFIINGENSSYYDFLCKIAKLLNKPKPKFKAGKLLSQVAWRVEAVKSFFTRGIPILTRESANNAMNSFEYDNSKIKEALGIQFIPLDQTVKETCSDFLKSQSEKSNFGVLEIK